MTTEDIDQRIAALEEKGDRESLKRARELKGQKMAGWITGPRDATSGRPKDAPKEER